MFKKNNNLNQVSLNKVWAEAIKRENKNITLAKSSDSLYQNPKTVFSVTQKPNKRGKRFLDKDSYLINYLKKKNVLKEEDFEHEEEERRYEEERKQKKLKSKRKEEMLLKDLKKTLSDPIEKYKMPVTVSHDVGWFAKTGKLNKKSQFHFPKNECAEVKYANLLMRETHMKKSKGKK